MKKAILSVFLSLVLLVPCAFAEASDADIAAYLQKLSAAPGRSLDEARSMLDALLAFEGTLPDEAVSGFMAFLGRIVDSLCDEYWDDETFADTLGENDLVSTRGGEGGIGYGFNYGAARAAFGDRLSEAYERYLELMEIHFSDYMVDDMALRTSWDGLAQFIIDWSVFRISYPRFIEVESVDNDIKFGVYLYTGCFNLDNTPVIYRNALSEEVRASYESFLSNPASADVILYYDDIAALYKVWKDNGFKYTKAVQKFIKDFEIKLYGTEGEG
jgi:hypothetical protein